MVSINPAIPGNVKVISSIIIEDKIIDMFTINATIDIIPNNL